MLWSEKILDMILIFLNILKFIFWPNMCSILENVPCSLEKCVFCWFFYLIECHVYMLFLLCLYHKWMLSSVICFCSIEIIIWFSPFISLTRCITVIDSQTLHHSCIPGINSTWLWGMILLKYFWVWFTIFCWRFLFLCSSEILAWNFLFFGILV